MPDEQTQTPAGAMLDVSGGAAELSRILGRSREMSQAPAEQPEQKPAAAPRDDGGRFRSQQESASPEGDGEPAAQAGTDTGEDAASAEGADISAEDWSDDLKPHVSTLTPEGRKAIKAYEAKLRSEIDATRNDYASKAQAADAERAQASQERQAYAAELTKFQTRVQSRMQELQKLDWDKLKSEDYARWVELSIERRDLADAHTAAQSEREHIAAREKQDTEKRREEIKAREHDKLMSLIPSWKDAAKRQVESRAVAEYLVGQGIPSAQVAEILDANSVAIARKAMLYDKLQADKAVVTKRVENVPKVIKPGSPRGRGDNAQDALATAMDKLKRDGSIQSGAAALRALVEARSAR